MTGRRAVVLAAAVIVVAAVIVALGRWEDARSAREQNAEMRAVLAKVGPLYATLPTGYRLGPPDCLSYALPSNVLGLEVCFDAAGRVVETADRSGAQPKYASLVYEPSLATNRVPRVLIARLFRLAEKHSG